MRSYSSFDGTSIAYEIVGADNATATDARHPVLLHHGFASSAYYNWVRPGLVDALVGLGRTVVYLDARGHGESGKPHDPAAYEGDAMVRDVRGLLDELSVETVDIAGYSMGAFVAMRLTPVDPRVRSLFLGGAGAGQIRLRHPRITAAIVAALETDDPSTIAEPGARAVRHFADATHSDRFALAAVQRTLNAPTAEEIRRIAVPTLIVNGDRDTSIGDPASLSEIIDGSRFILVPGDHLSAVVKPELRDALLAWADRHRAAAP
jgi:pimeloyl-ACP methyl ester carboxylesterase